MWATGCNRGHILESILNCALRAVEAALTQRNLRHFSQADGTPFTVSPLRRTYGPNGVNSPSSRLLHGTVDIKPSAVSEATYTILKNILLKNVPQIDHRMHKAQMIASMIEKLKGHPLLEKFRIIHLIPADLNMTMGTLFGFRLMQQGESLGQIGEEQCGSRKHKDCQDVQLLKHCIFSIVRLSRAHGSTFDNDAKSCFDRIVMLFPSILSQRLGMPAKVCNLLLTTLSQTQYKTKTTHGVSKGSYSTTTEHTVHGPGQGSRAAPAIWTLINCYLLALMKEKSQGVTLTDPDCSITAHQSSSGFVDDITHWNIHIRNSLLHPESPDTLLQSTTATAQRWENLLHSSGGKLELSKCFYYMFHWSFNADGKAYLSPPEYSETDMDIQIEHRAGTKSHKTLGKMENPSGNYEDETKRITEKAEGFAHKVLASGLNAIEALVLHNTIYLPAVCYSFASGTMTIQQAESAQSHFTLAILPKLNYHRNTPRTVVFAEPKIGGSGLRHLFAEQGTRQTRAILFHV